MAKHRLLALVAAAGVIALAPMAHSGGPTVPNTATVVSPSASVGSNSFLAATILEVAGAFRTGSGTGTRNVDGSVTFTSQSGASVTRNADSSFTVTTAGGTSTVVSSGFISAVIYAYF